MEELAKIIGSVARVKIMRLFLFNNDLPFDTDLVIARSKVVRATAQKELQLLLKVGFIIKTDFVKEIELKPLKEKGDNTIKTKRVKGFKLNPEFALAEPFRNLLIDYELVKTKDILNRLEKAGRVRLLVLSGIFTKDQDRSIDMLIVGDKLKKKEAERIIQTIESEIGKELRYAVFDTEEFIYRLKMFDKLVRDIFDYPHQKVVDKLKLSSY